MKGGRTQWANIPIYNLSLKSMRRAHIASSKDFMAVKTFCKRNRCMKQKNFKIILYIMAIWFLISFVTNIIGPLIPIIIKWYTINYALAGFLPFSFFLAYGVISIPAGFLLERCGQTVTMLGAFSLNALGCLLIASSASYLAVIAGLFVIGLGMAMLQVVINPLTRSTVGEEHFAFYAVLGQLVFGVASFLSPFALSLLQTSRAHVRRVRPTLGALLRGRRSGLCMLHRADREDAAAQGGTRAG